MNYDKVWDLHRRITDIQEEVQQLSSAKQETEEAIQRAMRVVTEAPGLKKQGNMLLIIAALLVVAEIALLFAGWHFTFLDVIIIGGVAVWGIVKKLSGNRKREALLGDHKDEKEAEAEIHLLNRKKEELTAAEEAKSAEREALSAQLDRLVTYTGRTWDIPNLEMTAENIRLLEEDAVAMMCFLAFAKDRGDYRENWIFPPLGILTLFDAEKREERKRYYEKMKESRSWILPVCRQLIRLFDLSLLGAAKEGLTGEKEALPSLAAELKEIGVGKVQTDLEMTLYNLLFPLSEGLFDGIELGEIEDFL